MTRANPDLTGAQKAAMVILALDEEVASAVLKNLDEGELRLLAKAVEKLDPVPYESLNPTLEEFEHKLRLPSLARGGQRYIHKLAASAIGKERADLLFASPKPKILSALERLKTAKAGTLAELLSDEHPQVAAVIISQLPAEQAAKVLLAMEEDRQTDLIGRMVSLEEIPAEALEVASETLLRALRDAGGVDAGGGREFDGVAFTAALFNELPKEEADRLLEDIEDSDPEVAPKIREAMFTFEDLGGMDTRSLQTLMREVSSDQLLIALKTAGEVMREKFFGAISQRAAATMREDLELMPPKRLSEVEAAQREIVEIAMRLAGEGQVVLPGGSGEEMV